MLHHLLQHVERHGGDVGAHERGLRHVVGAAHGCGDDFDLLAVDGVGREVVVVDGRDDVFHLRQTVFGDVVEAADERADVAGAGAGGQKRLRHAEAQRHVHRDALGGQRVRGCQALDHGGDLHDDVRRDHGQLAAVGHDLVARHGHGFGGHRAVGADDVADALHVVVEVVELAADFRVQRGVGGDAGQGAPACGLFDFG